jgi:hypothetical protein
MAEPPSGTPRPLAENENVFVPLFWLEKTQSIAIGSNPFPLTIPVPDILRNVVLRNTTVDVRRSKVKPPTLHRPGVGVDGLNIQGRTSEVNVSVYSCSLSLVTEKHATDYAGR